MTMLRMKRRYIGHTNTPTVSPSTREPSGLCVIYVCLCRVCAYVYEEEEEYDNAHDEEEIVHTNTPSTREPSG